MTKAGVTTDRSPRRRDPGAEGKLLAPEAAVSSPWSAIRRMGRDACLAATIETVLPAEPRVVPLDRAHVFEERRLDTEPAGVALVGANHHRQLHYAAVEWPGGMKSAPR